MLRAELKHPKQLPGAYLQRFTYDTVGHDAAIHRNLVRQVGPDRVLRACVGRLNGEIVRDANLPDVRAQLQAQGYVIFGSSPEQLTEAIGDALTRMGGIIGEANIKVK